MSVNLLTAKIVPILLFL